MARARILMVSVTLLATLPVTARADDYVKGIESYEARDFDKARKIFQPLAEAGDARAQYRIGAMHEYGIGGAADHTMALEWYRKSAAGDNADAQYALGEALLTGQGLDGNPVEAVAWFRKAAAQGRLHAFLMLAICYRDSADAPADIVMAHVYASIRTVQMKKMDLVEREKLSKELAAEMTKEQRAESESLQLQGMQELSRLPASSTTGQK
jgi:uncharacterized protein